VAAFELSEGTCTPEHLQYVYRMPAEGAASPCAFELASGVTPRLSSVYPLVAEPNGTLALTGEGFVPGATTVSCTIIDANTTHATCRMPACHAATSEPLSGTLPMCVQTSRGDVSPFIWPDAFFVLDALAAPSRPHSQTLCAARTLTGDSPRCVLPPQWAGF
jgi:hypothetical protein